MKRRSIKRDIGHAINQLMLRRSKLEALAIVAVEKDGTIHRAQAVPGEWRIATREVLFDLLVELRKP